MKHFISIIELVLTLLHHVLNVILHKDNVSKEMNAQQQNSQINDTKDLASTKEECD